MEEVSQDNIELIKKKLYYYKEKLLPVHIRIKNYDGSSGWKNGDVIYINETAESLHLKEFHEGEIVIPLCNIQLNSIVTHKVKI